MWGKRKYPKELTDKALSNGIKHTTFLRRKGLGWSDEDASTIPPGEKSEYTKYRRIANERGISTSTFNNRHFTLNWSLEEAAYSELHPVRNPLIKVAEEHGVSQATLHYRRNNGWNEEIAARVNAQDLKHYCQKAREEYGIHWKDFYAEVKKGTPLEEVADKLEHLHTTPKPVQKKPKKETKPNDDYLKYKKVANQKGISTAEYNQRIFDLGMSPQKASGEDEG